MTPSPLLMDDISLIQDVFLTKTLMLLARDAGPAEWQFERRVAEQVSGGRWVEVNAFLFDFTLGRTLCAICPPSLGNHAGSFADYFTAAIWAGDGRAARNIWAAEHTRHDHDDALTVLLLAYLMTPIDPDRRLGILENLPAGYRP